jgi:hypothetical protein
MATVISQMIVEADGRVAIRVWEAPDGYRLDPDPVWVEQAQPALPPLPVLPGRPGR